MFLAAGLGQPADSQKTSKTSKRPQILQETIPQETIPQETIPQGTIFQETIPQETTPWRESKSTDV